MIRALVLACLAILAPGLAAAQDCARLAAQAGAEAGLPDGLLPAISLVESGRGTGKGGIAPWPWTLNEGGKGMYFDTREAALAYLAEALARGVTNIDIGCMQLNWKWHSAGFASPEDMIDPARNTRYAARFMTELHNRLGSWETAASAYHSTDPDRGRRYLEKVMAARSSFRFTPEDAEGTAPQGGTLLTAIPTELDGILAHGGRPLIALASAPRADGWEGETPFDSLEEPKPDNAPEDAEMPLADAASANRPAPRADRAPPPRPTPAVAPPRVAPDLPLVLAAAATTLALPENLPPRLRHRWSEVEAMRNLLADDP